MISLIPTSIQKWKLKNLINEKFNRRKDKYKIKHNTFKFYTYYYNIFNKNIIKRIVNMLSLCLLITSRILVKCSYQGWNSIVFFGIKNNSKKMIFVFSIEFDFSRKYTELKYAWRIPKRWKTQTWRDIAVRKRI